MNRSLLLLVLAAACGESHATPDAAMTRDASRDAAPDSAPTGPYDTSFGSNGSAALPGTCQAIAVDASDRVLVLTTDASTSTHPPILTRFDASGHVDPMFAARTVGDTPPSFYGLLALQSGKILVWSQGSSTREGHVYRLNADGTSDIDTTLPYKFAVTAGAVERADGSIDLVDLGQDKDAPFAFARLWPDFTVDTLFGVKQPVTGFDSGYFSSAVSLGGGTLALSTTTQDVHGVWNIGNLLLAADGAVTKTVSLQGTQIAALASHDGKLYVLGSSVPGGIESLVRYDATLAPDPGFTSPEAASFMPTEDIGGDGARLAVAADGSVATTNGATLDRFHADGSARSTLPFGTAACGIVFDSKNRPVVGAGTTVVRLVQ